MIIFDFDGVISNSLTLCRDACQWAIEQQRNDISLELNPFKHLNPVTFESLAAQFGLNQQTFTIDVARFMEQHNFNTDIFEGMFQVITDLSKKYELHIVSVSDSKVVQSQLNRFGLEHRFTSILGGDHQGQKTIKIQRLRLQSEKKACGVVIGDCISDIEAANNRNAHSIGVTWGWQPESMLCKASPDELAHTPQQLINAVHRLIG